eukprot:TRINITY_DN59001_c0_g1_i1.p1 TRINITY_DN59001_c0_g1~~TRINITY_DN59001_c0_g1_i1.p1  ORF type:complete len:683 (+),score=140.64 TRINITY_DN59001_c0_g1_i1:148-2196(+)
MAAQPTLKDWNYDDLKVIGRGQYGKAHLVRSGVDSLLYIAKTIDLQCLSTKERETALQEVALLRRLDHPNIVSYKDNFFMGDTLVIIMQYCEGGDLATHIKDMLKKKTRIDEYQVMHYFVQILQALQYIHQERILHRDLKTSNLFLMKSKSVVKLGDFGISRVLEGSIEAAITVVGTPYYMSPEVCENKPYTFKSDVWSLGCVLYELCVLKHAFSADNLLGLVYKIVSDKYEPIPERYSTQLNTLIQRMLEKNADRRPSVRDLLADNYVQSFMNAYLDRIRGGTPGPSVPAATAVSGGSSGGGGSAPSRGPGSGGPAATGMPPRTGGGAPPRPPGAPVPGETRSSKPGHRHVNRGQHGSRQAGTGAGGGRGSGSPVVETPKEAVARRKREAADRKAAELKVAAKQSVHNKTMARQMREAEFQTTRGGAMGAAATATGHFPASPATAAGFGATANSPDSSTAAPTASAARSHPDDDEFDEDYLDSPEEDIDDESYSEEYEDDFEEEPYSEEDLVGSDIEEVYMAPGQGALSVVREKEDLSRVMNNYEQDLARNHEQRTPSPVPSSSSPSLPPRRTGTGNVERAPAQQQPLPAPAPTQSSGPKPGGVVMDMRSRATRLKEELMRKMGADTFNQAFQFLYNARMKNMDQRDVKRELEMLVGREIYKNYCFDVDQLVFQALTYGGS